MKNDRLYMIVFPIFKKHWILNFLKKIYIINGKQMLEKISTRYAIFIFPEGVVMKERHDFGPLIYNCDLKTWKKKREKKAEK